MRRRKNNAPGCGGSEPHRSSSLRTPAEKIMAEKGFTAMSPADAERLVHELQAHRIELETQNEELKRAQRVIEESHEKYVDLYDFAPVGYFSFDEKGAIMEVNLTGASLIGIERTQLIGRPFSLFVSPQHRDIFFTHRQKAQQTAHVERCELLIQRKDLSPVHVLMESVIAADTTGNLTIRSAVTDITERTQAEEALRESEASFRSLVENSAGPIFIVQGEGFVYINRVFTEDTGYTLKDLSSMKFWDIIAPEMRETLKANAMARQQLAHTVPAHYELRITTKSGEEKLASVGVTLIEFKKKPAILGSVTDFTEHKRAEEKILKQTTLLEGINRIFHEAMTCESKEKLCTVCLSVAEELTGSKIGFIGEIRSDGQLYDITISNPGWDLCGAYDKTGHHGPHGVFRIHGLYGHVLEHGRSLLTNDPALHPDSVGLPKGHPPLTAFLGVPLIETGKTMGLVAVGNREGGYTALHQEMLETLAPAIVQVLLRRRAEDEVRKSHDELELRVAERTAAVTRLAAAVESAAESVFVTDSSWQIEYANPAFYDITGYTADEIIGREMGFLRAEKEAPSVYDRSRQAAISGKPYASRYTIRRKDGTAFPVESVKSPVKNASGEIRNFVIVWRDMSEQLRLEEQLRQAHKLEAIGTLAGGIAHDFNNMLAIIMGNAELAMDDVKNGDLPERNLDHIFIAAKRGRDLVKEILTFSRKAQRERTPTDVISVLQETFKLLRSTLPTTIKMALDIQSESGIILGDSVQVQQVLMNLSTNATHAMRKAGGTLTIRLADVTFQAKDTLPDPDIKPGQYLKLIVEDTGTGMTDEVRHRISEPFFTTKKTGEGTGMGLSVVYGIVKSHNGAINVESTPGKGSTFVVYLPKAESRARKEEDAAGVIRGNQEHILFIDDEHPLTELAEAMLKKLGYRVTAVTDSKEAWSLFLKDPHAFDLVITDETMPDITGITLAQRMLRIRPDVPVLLCTGYSETVSPEKARKAGTRDFLMKPLVKGELAGAIRRALDGREGGQ